MILRPTLHAARDANPSRTHRLAVWVLPALVVVSGACNVDTTGTPPSLVPHCSDVAGNATCFAEYPDRPYCNLCVPVSQNEGCVSTLPAPSCSVDSSTSPETGDDDESSTGGSSSSTSTGEMTTTLTSADTSGDGSSTTVAPYMCREEGQIDEDCDALDPAAPYCIESACLGCGDGGGDEFCGSIDPLLPACDLESGRCVSCANADEGFCGGATPVCGDSGACQGCTEHSECITACHIAPSDPLQGECFASDQVVWVDASAECPGLGTELAPACSLADAIMLISPGESWTVFAEGGANYAEQVAFDGKTIAVRGNGNVQITGDALLDDATMVVNESIVYLENLRVRGNVQSHGLSCENSTLWVDDSQVRNNLEYGIHTTQPCDVTLRRSSVLRNVGGGVRQFGGVLTLDNASVVANGDSVSGPGINLQFSELRATYSTIGGNDGVGADSVQCLDASGTIRNSIVTGAAVNSIELDCFVFELVSNAIDTATFVEAGSIAIGPYDTGWFVNPSEGDMRLSDPAATLFFQIAVWLEGDAPLDADGTPRPMGGAFGYVGVDEP